MKKFLTSLLAIFYFSLTSVAQDAKSFREQYEAFSRQAKSTYTDFRNDCNKKYVEFLRGAWEWFQVRPGLEMPEEATPIPPVVYDEESPVIRDDRQVVIEDIVPVIEEDERPEPVSPIVPEPVATINRVTIDFFGTDVSIAIPDESWELAGIDGNSLADAWEKLCDGRYNQTLADCLTLRDELSLNDWAYLLLLLDYVDGSNRDASDNKQIFLTSFLYCQSGYDMRIAQTENSELCMLFSSKHQIIGCPYLVIDEMMYYIIGDVEVEQLASITESFGEAKPLSLWINESMRLSWSPSKPRRLLGDIREMQIDVSVNQNVIDFYDTYPTSTYGEDIMSRWAMYANKPLDEETRSILYPQLQSILSPLGESDYVNCLLNFVQTSLMYEYDDKVWGCDRAFFPEESLFYPYCDCEDRSILFSRLVRDLVGLDVLLVYYPGHLATAVHFNDDVKGDYIMYKGEKYVVCDPTYIGAPIGTTMPEMDNKTAKVVKLSR